MCSICGIVDFFNSESVSPQIAENMGRLWISAALTRAGLLQTAPLPFSTIACR